MAHFVPVLSSVVGKMTSGERRFARRLESHLEDDYICWYDVPVGSLHQHPDFLVFHPRRGLLVLEVKDWKLESIQSIDRIRVTLQVDGRAVRTASPMEQARQYAHRITQLLGSDPALVGEPGSSYEGKLIFPWGYGVVLANISRKNFQLTDLGQVIPPDRVICQDEMVESVDAEAFQQRLWGMFGVTFRCLLTLPQVDRVRWHLFPEIRVSQGTFDLGSPSAPKFETVPDIVRVMDLQQEQLARSMGEGHRVIHGVAGSGKTMILGYRAQSTAPAGQALSWHGTAVFVLYKIWDNRVKPVVWLGDSRARIRDFAPDGRHDMGIQLGRVQLGEAPADWKPMPSVGLGVSEIRVRVGGAFRLIYMAKFVEAIYVLHAFQKKSRKTAQADIDLARLRFRALIRDRRQQ